MITLAIVFLEGCSTPNIKTFVDGTLQINELATSEHGEMKSKLTYLSKVHPSTSKRTKISKKLKEFNNASTKIEAIFALLIDYSNSLNVLVGDKTDGEKAISELSSNLSNISSLLGIGGNSLDIGKTTKTVAKWITEMQKQKELEKAMAFADPIVQVISKEISDDYTDTMVGLANGITGFLEGLLDDQYPINAIGFYVEAIDHKNVIYQNMRFRLENIPKDTYMVLCPTTPISSNCISKDTIDAFNKINILIDKTKPIYDGYMKELKEIKNWEKNRIEKLKKLATLSKTWAKEHSRILGILRDCNSLSKKCKELNSINIINIAKQ